LFFIKTNIYGAMMLKRYSLFFLFIIISISTPGQSTVTHYKLQKDTVSANKGTIQVVDSASSLSGLQQLYSQQEGLVKDSLAQITSFIGSMEDSLQSLKILKETELQRAVLLDTLSKMQLPGELADFIDSLRSLPTMVQDMQSKIDIKQYQSVDTLVTRYIDKARSFITDQQQNMEDKASSLLPKEFYHKLGELKSKTETGDLEIDALSRVDDLTSKYELDYEKYLFVAQLQQYLDMDLEFLNNMDGYLDQLGGYSGKFDQYMSELNSYLGKADISGLADHDLTNLQQYSGQLALSDNMSLDGFAELEGINVEEVENLISEYGNMDAETLDQRIDQLASKYGEVGELQGQVSAFEGMQADQLAELEQLKSLAATRFDEKMALKKGQVLANDVLVENSDVVQTAMKEVDAFKKKYSIVTNSNFKEEDVEPPTKHVELEKRFFFGGDMQLLPGKPLGIDFSGLAGYKLSNRSSIGLAGSVRYEFEESENYMPDFKKEPVYGGRAFMQYKAIKSFFIQGEVEAANAYNEGQQKVWEINYLAGIGRAMAISEKLRINISFLYHINNEGSYAHDKPYVIRIGLCSR
jgi:hypothetical protein